LPVKAIVEGKTTMRAARCWHFALAGIVLLASGGRASACSSFEGVPVFTPNVKKETDRWFRSRVDVDKDDSLRAISARVVSVRRAGPHDLCDFGTSIKVEVRWAEPTDVRLEDVGIYFKVASGTGGLGAVEYDGLSDLPRVVTIENGIAYVNLFPSDTDSRPREEIDLDVEVFAVDHLLRIGPSSRLRVRSGD
jgi:hypothetical protein